MNSILRLKSALLTGNRIVVPEDNQFLQWNESRRRLELWEEKPLRRITYFLRKTVLMEIVNWG